MGMEAMPSNDPASLWASGVAMSTLDGAGLDPAAKDRRRAHLAGA